MANAKQKHYALDMVNELPSHHGRNASELALKLGKIPLCEHVANLKFFRAAGTAKHVNAIRKNKTAAWADINDDRSGDDKLPPPPVSGRYEASTNDSILATTQSVKLLPPPASGKQQQSATHVAPARERQQTCSHSGATVQGALCAGTTRCPQVEQLVPGALCAGTTRCPQVEQLSLPSGGAALCAGPTTSSGSYDAPTLDSILAATQSIIRLVEKNFDRLKNAEDKDPSSRSEDANTPRDYNPIIAPTHRTTIEQNAVHGGGDAKSSCISEPACDHDL